jgi:sulfite reductase alpha subunit-like flavoprotein
VYYGSLSNTSKKFATTTAAALQAECRDVTDVDVEDLLAFPPDFLAVIISSYNCETALDSALAHFDEAANDFRVGKALHKMHFAVLGVGHSSWTAAEYQSMAKKMDRLLDRLGARRIKALSFVDMAVGTSAL